MLNLALISKRTKLYLNNSTVKLRKCSHQHDENPHEIS